MGDLASDLYVIPMVLIGLAAIREERSMVEASKRDSVTSTLEHGLKMVGLMVLFSTVWILHGMGYW